MANTFKIKTNDAMPTSAGTPLTLYTVPGSTTTIVLGHVVMFIQASADSIESDTGTNANVHAIRRTYTSRLNT